MNEQQSPKDQLTDQLENIKRWKRLSEMEKIRAIQRFMKSIGRLYLDYFQNHIEEAKTLGIGYDALLKSEFRTIDKFYVFKLWAKLDGEDALADLWETACWGRTNIEAFNDMFGEITGNLDLEDIDIYMKNKLGGVGLYQEEIPKNAPKTHWWWFVQYGRHLFLHKGTV